MPRYASAKAPPGKGGPGWEYVAYMRDPKPWQNVYECRFCLNADSEEIKQDPDYETATTRFGACSEECFVCLKPRSKVCETAAEANALAKEWAEKAREAAASTNSKDLMWHTNAKFGETKIWKFLEPSTFDAEVNCFGFGRFYSVWTERANQQGYYKSNICLFSGNHDIGSFEFEFYAKKQPLGKEAEMQANRKRVAGERVAPPNSIAAVKAAEKAERDAAQVTVEKKSCPVSRAVKTKRKLITPAKGSLKKKVAQKVQKQRKSAQATLTRKVKKARH